MSRSSKHKQGLYSRICKHRTYYWMIPCDEGQSIYEALAQRRHMMPQEMKDIILAGEIGYLSGWSYHSTPLGESDAQ